MTDFLLIHGSAHGAWCWDYLIPHLTRAGHRARAIDLPSHGADRTPCAHVTLDSYADAIREALCEQTVIVAHSMAGFPATLAADQAPAQVAQLIYLCAHIPQPGKSITDMRAMADSQPLARAMIPSTDGITISIDPAQARDRFYHDVPADLAAWAIGNLCPQPIVPQQTPYPEIPAGDYARHYIRCSADRAIPLSYQIARTADWPKDDITTLPTAHSPFLADPAALTATLCAISERQT